MRILMLAPGHVIHSLRPLNWLLQAGHQVLFIDGENPFPDGRENFFFIPYLNSSDSFVIPMLKAIAQDFLPHVTHVHWLDHRAYQCMAAGLKPLLLTAWGSDVNHYFTHEKMFLLDIQLMQETLRYAHTIFVDTPDIENKCMLLAHKPISTRLLTLGVNTHQFKPGYRTQAQKLRTELGISPGARVLLSIRALTPLYNHGQILIAFYNALPHFKHETVLLFKKYNNRDFYQYELQMQELIKKIGLESSIKWLDDCPFDQLPTLYALSTGIVSFPLMDAFPVTFLEAAACLRPVLSHLLPAYENTFAQRYFNLVPAGDVDALSRRLIEVVNTPNSDPITTRNLKAARQEVLTHYDQAITIRTITQVYQELSATFPQPDTTALFPPVDWQVYLEKGLQGLCTQNPDSYQEMYQLASVLKRLGAYEKARLLFQTITKQVPKIHLVARAFFHLGEIALYGGDKPEAAVLFEQCVTREPGHTKARDYLLSLQHQTAPIT